MAWDLTHRVFEWKRKRFAQDGERFSQVLEDLRTFAADGGAVYPNLVVDKIILSAEEVVVTASDPARMEFIRGLGKLVNPAWDQISPAEGEKVGQIFQFSGVPNHVFFRDGARKIVSSMLDGRLRPVPVGEMEAMGFDTQSQYLFLKQTEVYFFYNGYSPTFGPDFATLSRKYRPSMIDTAPIGGTPEIPEGEILFYLVSTDAKKEFILKALEMAEKAGFISRERRLRQIGKVKSYSDISALTKAEFGALLESLEPPAAEAEEQGISCRGFLGAVAAFAVAGTIERIEGMFEEGKPDRMVQDDLLGARLNVEQGGISSCLLPMRKAP